MLRESTCPCARPRWALIADLLAVGSTRARSVCRDQAQDPEYLVCLCGGRTMEALAVAKEALALLEEPE